MACNINMSSKNNSAACVFIKTRF